MHGATNDGLFASQLKQGGDKTKTKESFGFLLTSAIPGGWGPSFSLPAFPNNARQNGISQVIVR
jgi:hypothetical protein